MRRVLRLGAVVLIFLVMLYIGGYNWATFSRSISIKDPERVFKPLIDAFPGKVDFNVDYDPTDTNFTIATGKDPGLTIATGKDEPLPTITTSPNGSNPTESGDTIPLVSIPSGDETLKTNKIDVSLVRILSVSINGKTVDLKLQTSASFIKWLANNYKDGDDVSMTTEDGQIISGTKPSETTETSVDATSETTIESSETTTEATTTETTKKGTPTPTPNPKIAETSELSYDDTLKDRAHLNALIADIQVVKKLPKTDGYDRNTFEKPVKSYILGGIKLNRNNYSWMSSPFFNQKDFTFTCPYTGKVITDMDDKKQDNDFGNLDYDHIVPLKSAYLRGASEWSKEQQNEYAYNQWVGVDVLASANRSKSDKGPMEYLPDVNIEDYCYSWLLICSKYDLVMTQDEIDLCKKHINAALESGEPVTHLGGHYS